VQIFLDWSYQLVLITHAWLMQVLVAKVFRLEVRNALDSKIAVAPGHMYVEVTARTAEGEHAPACQAIGALQSL